MAGGKTDKPEARAERLKAALRENLRRRKAQGRGRAEAGTRPEAPDEPAPHRPDSDKTGP